MSFQCPHCAALNDSDSVEEAGGCCLACGQPLNVQVTRLPDRFDPEGELADLADDAAELALFSD